MCLPTNLNACNELELARIEEWMKMSEKDIEHLIHETLDRKKNARLNFEREMRKLQKIYDDMNDSRELQASKIKRHIKLLNQVQAINKIRK